MSKNVCTGLFYTLASCDPNGCGMPNSRRDDLGKRIDRHKFSASFGVDLSASNL